MTEAVLQILLLLAYLVIGLISVTFPIYAICVAYLRQEKWESKKERKKRVEKLKERIAKLTSELSGNPHDSKQFKEIERALKDSKSELNSVQLRLDRLTAIGAVGVPVLFLAIALVFAGVGIFFFYEGLVQTGLEQIRSEQIVLICIAFSSSLSGTAIIALYRTISAVEYAALRPARSIEFDVSFVDGKKSTQLKLGKESRLDILIGSREADVENCVAYVIIPSEIEVVGESASPKITISKHRDYSLVVEREIFAPKNWMFGPVGNIIPKKLGKYTLDVSVCAKGIYEYKEELIVNVVK